MDLQTLVKLSENTQYQEIKQKIEAFNKQKVPDFTEKAWNNIITLDFQRHTLLLAFLFQDIKITQNNVLVIDRFIKLVDAAQLKVCIEEVKKVINKYLEYMKNLKQQNKTLRALYSFLVKLNQAALGICSIHNIFLKLCIEYRQYKLALNLLKYPESNVMKEQNAELIDLCMYFYNFGNILVACKQFKEAQQMFEQVYMLKQRHFHEIHIETKKILFLLAIRKGSLKDDPIKDKEKSFQKHNQDAKILELTCETYQDLQNINIVPHAEAYEAYLNKNAHEFLEDGNLGLVKQCRFSTMFYQMKKLSKVYNRYRINDLYTSLKISPQQVSMSQLLKEIIKIRPLFKINQKLQCIEFIKKSSSGYTENIMKPLSLQIDQIKSIQQQFEKERQKIIIEKTKNNEQAFN